MGKSTINGSFSIAMLVYQRGNGPVSCQELAPLHRGHTLAEALHRSAPGVWNGASSFPSTWEEMIYIYMIYIYRYMYVMWCDVMWYYRTLYIYIIIMKLMIWYKKWYEPTASGDLILSRVIRLMGIRLSTIGFTHRIGRLIGGNNCCWWL